MKKSSEFLSEYHVERNCNSVTYIIESYLFHLVNVGFKKYFGLIINNHHANSSWHLKCPAHAYQFMFFSILFSIACDHKTLLDP